MLNRTVAVGPHQDPCAAGISRLACTEMLRLPFELMLALRYLSPKRTFVSVITLISVFGVMLGVAVLIIVISVMTGFDHQLTDRILGFNAHLKITSDEPIVDYESVADIVSTNRLVKGAAPFVFGQVLAETQSDGGAGLAIAPVIRGVDANREGKVSVLLSSVIEGAADVRGNGILVGRVFASKLGLTVGDRLAIYSIPELRKMEREYRERSGKSADSRELFLATDFEVRGVFDVGYYEFNDMFVVCSLANAQDLTGMGDAVHGLMVILNDPMLADQARNELEQVLGPGYRISTWKEDYSDILDALLVEKNVMFYLLFFIMIVAAFGITSALITFVVQKTREIGILKALGASSRQIMWIFLSQSMFVGVLGVAAGYGLGMLAVSYRNEFLFFLRRVTGFQLFPEQIYSFRELPALIIPSDIWIICGGSLLICLLAGMFPAWNAGRMKPVEALRHE